MALPVWPSLILKPWGWLLHSLTWLSDQNFTGTPGCLPSMRVNTAILPIIEFWEFGPKVKVIRISRIYLAMHIPKRFSDQKIIGDVHECCIEQNKINMLLSSFDLQNQSIQDATSRSICINHEKIILNFRETNHERYRSQFTTMIHHRQPSLSIINHQEHVHQPSTIILSSIAI